MRTLNMREFEDYCNGIQNACYVFSTENQTEFPESMCISLRFDKISISINPNRISLTEGRSRIIMNNVKRINLYDDTPSIGIRTDIVCRDHKKDITYSFLID